MPKVLYGVSPIGLGHATRSSLVIRELMERGAEVKVFSGGNAAEFLRGAGIEVDDVVDDAVPTVAGLEMSGVAWWYLRSWLAQRRNVRRAARLVGSFRPDLVVCDEEFSGMAAAQGAGVRRVFISDELDLGFARTWVARKVEGRVERWYAHLLRTADLVIVPDDGEDVANVRHVGSMARKRSLTAAETRSKHGLPSGRLLLLSMSGSGIGRELVSQVASALDTPELRDVTLVVSGNRGERLAVENVRDLGVVADNQNLVACSDLVVSTAGKSTIDEAAAFGTPIIAIPIRYHAEQERNAAPLGYRWEDAARLRALILQKIGRRGPPREFSGELAASRLILSLA